MAPDEPQQVGTHAPVVLQMVQCNTDVQQMPNGDVLVMITTPWLAVAVPYTREQWEQVRALPGRVHIAGVSDMPPPPKVA